LPTSHKYPNVSIFTLLTHSCKKALKIGIGSRMSHTFSVRSPYTYMPGVYSPYVSFSFVIKCPPSNFHLRRFFYPPICDSCHPIIPFYHPSIAITIRKSRMMSVSQQQPPPLSPTDR